MNLEHLLTEPGWKQLLRSEFDKSYTQVLSQQIKQMGDDGITVYPPIPLIFNAFHLTPWDQVRVVLLGQDPYHHQGAAMGLSFSVPRTSKIPPSLRNIYKELEADLDIPPPAHGDLSQWARQGVLLLNSVLTVEHAKAASHKHIGWVRFTDAVISLLSEQKKGLVFVLWGRVAQSKIPLIDFQKHHILTAAHPSPLARNAFSGCRHFSLINTCLVAQELNPIDWRLEL